MKHWSFYKADGSFVERWFSSTSPDAIDEQWIPPELTAREGNFHPLAHRVNTITGEIVRAEQPSVDHEWSEGAGRWELPLKAFQARAEVMQTKARLADLSEAERHLIRKLTLNPNDIVARTSLTKVDQEIEELRKVIGRAADSLNNRAGLVSDSVPAPDGN